MKMRDGIDLPLEFVKMARSVIKLDVAQQLNYICFLKYSPVMGIRGKESKEIWIHYWCFIVYGKFNFTGK